MVASLFSVPGWVGEFLLLVLGFGDPTKGMTRIWGHFVILGVCECVILGPQIMLSSYIRSFDVTSSSVVIQILVLLELLLFCSWIPRRIEYNSYVSYEFSYLFFLKNRVTTMRESLASKPVISSLLRNVGSFFFKKDDSRCGLTSQNLPEFQARDHLT